MRPGTCRPAVWRYSRLPTPVFGPAPCSSRMSSRPSPSASNSAPPPYIDLGHEVLAGRPAVVGERQPDGVGHVLEPAGAPAGASGAESVGVSVRAAAYTRAIPSRNPTAQTTADRPVGRSGHGRAVGSGKAIRAAATARGTSPRAVAEPCHRRHLPLMSNSNLFAPPASTTRICLVCLAPLVRDVVFHRRVELWPSSRRRRPCSSPGTPGSASSPSPEASLPWPISGRRRPRPCSSRPWPDRRTCHPRCPSSSADGRRWRR